ncbi:hypothetical protein J5X07_05755 [Actinomyces bowdenii]|uniref:hypothetical protein n=1 Tax=Actinomyces bowdenii TaxID=131109 RepID=UPI001ABBE79C|nr:hypothetical protein [Actinomyces bowdenii]MBO3724536.1 hypothetical protein [Actinomyces bowdenii]
MGPQAHRAMGRLPGAVEQCGSGQGAPAPGARHSGQMACGVEVARRYQAVEATEPAAVVSSAGSFLSV